MLGLRIMLQDVGRSHEEKTVLTKNTLMRKTRAHILFGSIQFSSWQLEQAGVSLGGHKDAVRVKIQFKKQVTHNVALQ
jgi:hypothetical protein